VTSESFKVTPEMRQQVLARLRAKGVDISPTVFNGASALLDRQLTYEITRYVFGRPAEFKRQATDDRQMQTAMALLRKAQSPKELMSLAAASHGTAPAQN
jgi:hypothetical protein